MTKNALKRVTLNSFLFAFLTILSLESCTKKVLITEEDGFKYYKLECRNRIGAKDLDGNVIIPIKMKSWKYFHRNDNGYKEKFFICDCFDNSYKEAYNAVTGHCIISEDLEFKRIMYMFESSEFYHNASPVFFVVSKLKEGGGKGVYNYEGQEIIPQNYYSISGMYYRSLMGDAPEGKRYYDHNFYICCRRSSLSNSAVSVFDSKGNCVIPSDYGYTLCRKTNVPTSVPLFFCHREKDHLTDLRYVNSGELFLRSKGYRMKVVPLDPDYKLFYLNSWYEGVRTFYDMYGVMILSGSDIGFNKENGFYRKVDYEYHYINKTIGPDGHVIPLRTYSDPSWNNGWYGNQWDGLNSGAVWEYEWNDLSSPSNNNQNNGVSHECSRCRGTGRVVLNTYPIQFGNTPDIQVRCPECGEYFMQSVGHTHIDCPQCGGRGYR